DARDAETEVLFEVAVLAGDDRLAKVRGHVVVADHDAPLDGELTDDAAVARQESRDRVRLIVVEGTDLRNVAGEREQHAAHAAQESSDDEEGDEAGVARDAQYEFALGPGRCRRRLASADGLVVQRVHLFESKTLTFDYTLACFDS